MPISRCLLVALLVGAGLADAHAFDTTQTREDVTLHYRDPSDALAAPVRERIIETFFGAYLRERADFHPAAPTQVGIVIDPGYDGIAFVGEKAQAATITINPASTISRATSAVRRMFSARSSGRKPRSRFSPCRMLSPSST